MNDSAIKKHVTKTWRYKSIIIARVQGKLWVGDAYCLIHIADVPRIPNDGESFTESGDIRFKTKGPNIQATIDRTLEKADKKLIVTKWFIENNSDYGYARLFETRDGQKIYVDTVFLNLLVGKEDELRRYEFYGEGPAKAIMVKDEGQELMAILMPIDVRE